MSNFPSHLIPDILHRLPVKALLRFRCLSRTWASVIDDSNFAKLHLQQSLRNSTNVKLLLDNITENHDQAYSVDFDSFSNLTQFPRPFTAESSRYQSRIFGSCNGLLAVYHRQEGIALWNPSTRKCHYLPKLDDDIISDHDILPDYEYDSNTILGFGYDIIGNDFKVVEMLRSRTQNRFRVMVYSLRAHSWRRIKDCPYDIPYNYTDGPYKNGSLHWVGNKINDDISAGTLIFALDLGNEEYREVSKRDDLGRDFFYMNVGVLGGCLCVSHDCSNSYGADYVVLWVMKEYGVKESWTELIYLVRGYWLTNIFHTRAVSYSRKGDKILLDDGGCNQPAWFVLEDESGESLCIPGAPQLFTTTIYVDSLVSFN